MICRDVRLRTAACGSSGSRITLCADTVMKVAEVPTIGWLVQLLVTVETECGQELRYNVAGQGVRLIASAPHAACF